MYHLYLINIDNPFLNGLVISTFLKSKYKNTKIVGMVSTLVNSFSKIYSMIENFDKIIYSH